MRIVDSILQELKQEAATTRKFLERVPNDKLSYKPHEKSLTLGQLSLHVAKIPGDMAYVISQSEMEFPKYDSFHSPKSTDELLPTFEKNL